MGSKQKKKAIMRFFNTAGPVRCEDHYCVPPLERFDTNAEQSMGIW